MTLLPPPGSLRRRSLLGAFGAVVLRGLPLAAATAMAATTAVPAAEPSLTSFDVTRDEDGVYLDYAVDLELAKSVDEALVKSVPLFFVAEAEIFRDRWYWRDRRVADTVRVWKIVYQPLTSTYRVTTVGGLSQNYSTRGEAISSISRSTHWKIAEPGQLEEGSRHYVEFNFRLDTTLLPRPMQIGISGQPDWQLSIKRTQRIN
jgi:hypothetical protein